MREFAPGLRRKHGNRAEEDEQEDEKRAKEKARVVVDPSLVNPGATGVNSTNESQAVSRPPTQPSNVTGDNVRVTRSIEINVTAFSAVYQSSSTETFHGLLPTPFSDGPRLIPANFERTPPHHEVSAAGPRIPAAAPNGVGLGGEVDEEGKSELQALRELVAAANPDGLDEFDEMLGKVFGIRSPDKHKGNAEEQASAVSHGAQRLNNIVSGAQIAFKASIAEMHAKLKNGEEVSASSLIVSFKARFDEVIKHADPLILDLNGNGQIDTTTVEDGHRFDIRGDGKDVQVATVDRGDAYLALDRNGNGLIDDGSELFGDQHSAPHGFAELAKYDRNHDGQINELDDVYKKLQAYFDANKNGKTDSGKDFSRNETFGFDKGVEPKLLCITLGGPDSIQLGNWN